MWCFVYVLQISQLGMVTTQTRAPVPICANVREDFRHNNITFYVQVYKTMCRTELLIIFVKVKSVNDEM